MFFLLFTLHHSCPFDLQIPYIVSHTVCTMQSQSHRPPFPSSCRALLRDRTWHDTLVFNIYYAHSTAFGSKGAIDDVISLWIGLFMAVEQVFLCGYLCDHYVHGKVVFLVKAGVLKNDIRQMTCKYHTEWFSLSVTVA